MRPGHYVSALLALALASLGQPTHAQTPEQLPIPVLPLEGFEAPKLEFERVCILVLHRWQGSPEETKAIQSRPVPASIRWPNPDDPCDSTPLPGDLLLWHLSFGTEASALAAADAIASKALERLPKSGIRAELMKSWRTALRDHQAAGRRLARDPQNKTLQGAERLGQRRLIATGAAPGDYRAAANHYLEIADVFASQAALTQAERYLALEAEAQAFLTQDLAKSTDPIPADVRDDLFKDETPRLGDLSRLRAAVLRARIQRTPDAFSAAVAQLQATARPEFQEGFNKLNQSPGEPVCQSTGDDHLKALDKACNTASFFEREFIDFIAAAAQLDALMMPDRPKAFAQQLTTFSLDRTIAYMELEWHENWGGAPSSRIVDLPLHRIITLSLMRASSRTSGKEPDHDLAEELLLNTERRAPPDAAPTRFRQIAAQYLANHQAMLTAAAADHAQLETSRPAAYFRRTLENLDAIAAAE